MGKSKYYAVRRGKEPGIYPTWDECKAQIHGFANASYKKFTTLSEAKAFLEDLPVAEKEQDLSRGLHIFVDGSYEVKSGRFSYGLVGFRDGAEFEECRAFDDEEASAHRNVAGELYGAFRAIQIAVQENIPELDLYYDYAGIEKWATGEWRCKTKLTKQYSDTYNEFRSGLTVRFHKIEAHTGHVYNERADQLAKQALVQEEKIVKRI